jgi:hypothetical protein
MASAGVSNVEKEQVRPRNGSGGTGRSTLIAVWSMAGLLCLLVWAGVYVLVGGPLPW